MSQLTSLLSGLKPIRTTRATPEVAPRVAQPTWTGSCSTSMVDCCASTQHGSSVSACSIVTVATVTTACFDDAECDADNLCGQLSETLCEPSLWQSIRCQEAQRPMNQHSQPAAVLRCAAPSATTRQTSQCGAASQCQAPASDWSDSYIDEAIIEAAVDHALISIASPSPADAATACRAGAAQPPAMDGGSGCGGGRRVASTGLFHPQQQQPSHHHQQQHRHHPMQLPALYGLCPQPQLHRHAYLHTCHPTTTTTAAATATASTTSHASAARYWRTRTLGSSPIPVPSPLPGLAQRPRPSAEPFIDRAEDDEVLVQKRRQMQRELQEQQRQRLLIEEEADLLLLELEQQEREEEQQRREQERQREPQQAAKPAPRDWRENKMLLAVMGYYNAHRQERAKRESLSGRPAEPQRVVMGFAV